MGRQEKKNEKKTWGRSGSKKPLTQMETKPEEKVVLKPTKPFQKKPRDTPKVQTPTLKPLKTARAKAEATKRSEQKVRFEENEMKKQSEGEAKPENLEGGTEHKSDYASNKSEDDLKEKASGHKTSLLEAVINKVEDSLSKVEASLRKKSKETIEIKSSDAKTV